MDYLFHLTKIFLSLTERAESPEFVGSEFLTLVNLYPVETRPFENQKSKIENCATTLPPGVLAILRHDGKASE